MWMVARAINFDVENYNRVYNTADRALKKRYSKNFIRLVDNPFAYMFWHSRPYMQSGAFKFLPFFWFITIGVTWWEMGKMNYRNSLFTAYEGVMSGHRQWEFPVEVFNHDKSNSLLMHEHEFMMDKGLVSQKAAPPYKKFCKLNHYTRDQNYRKYLAYRERRGVDLFTGRPK
jgi:hypothetical protein